MATVQMPLQHQYISWLTRASAHVNYAKVNNYIFKSIYYVASVDIPGSYLIHPLDA